MVIEAALVRIVPRRRGLINEEDVLSFAGTSIRSVWTLEMLLLMSRSATRAWSAEALARELRASESIVSNGLSELQAAGLVIHEQGATFRYGPASAALDDLVRSLAQLYRERPFAVTRAIFASPSEKLRSFADAFRFKKD
jgi:biotin operon repressor